MLGTKCMRHARKGDARITAGGSGFRKAGFGWIGEVHDAGRWRRKPSVQFAMQRYMKHAAVDSTCQDIHCIATSAPRDPLRYTGSTQATTTFHNAATLGENSGWHFAAHQPLWSIRFATRRTSTHGLTRTHFRRFRIGIAAKEDTDRLRRIHECYA